MAATNHIRLSGTEPDVQVTTDDETVSVRLGDGADGITLVGSRFDVHRVIIEADRQLGRLTSRFPLP